MAVKILLKKYLPKIILSWTGFLFIGLGIYFFVLLPQEREKDRLDGRFDELSDQLKQARNYIGELSKTSLGREVASLKEQASLFIVNPNNASNLTLDISGLSKSFNLASMSIRNHEDRDIQNCTRIVESPLRVTFRSSFSNFFLLLNRLERHQPVVFIDSFSISRSRQEKEGNEVTMDVSVFVSKHSST